MKTCLVKRKETMQYLPFDIQHSVNVFACPNWGRSTRFTVYNTLNIDECFIQNHFNVPLMCNNTKEGDRHASSPV